MSQKEEEDDLDAFFDQVEEAAREAAVASEELPLLDHGNGNVDVDDRNNHLERQQQKQQQEEEYHKDNGKVVKEVKEEEPIAVQGTKTAITTGTGQQDEDDDDETGIEVRRPAKRVRVDHHHHEEPNEQDPERNATSAATTAANGGTVVVSKKATATISVPPIHHHHLPPYHPSRHVEEKEEKKDIYHITVPEHALPPPPPPPAPPQPPMPMHASQSYPPSTQQQQQQQQQQQPNMPLDISQEGNVKPALRIAAGKTWVDPNLSQFPENDYRLFVGNLDKVITEQKLAEAFQSKYPSFVMCRIVYDKITGLSKGYGFVSLMDPKDCARAIREMDQSWLGSRPIKVKRSDWKERDLKLVQKQNKKKKKHK